jgi:large subunit ribosomal protein L23
MTKPLHQILIRPLLTEKSVSLTQPSSDQARVKYIFAVALNANKVEIAKAVEAYFATDKVKVEAVNTLRVRGRKKRTMGKAHSRQPASYGTTPAWKKAIVTIRKNSPTIPLLEGG